jgi:hypothetical protein
MDARGETSNLATVFLPPSKDATLTIAATHEPLYFPGIHSFGLCAICYSISVFKVNSMLVQQMQSLLFVI